MPGQEVPDRGQEPLRGHDADPFLQELLHLHAPPPGAHLRERSRQEGGREARQQEVDEAIVRLGGGSSSSLNALSSSLNPSSLPPFSPFLLRSSVFKN